MLAEMAGHDLQRVRLRIPPSRGDILSLLHREGRVESQDFDADITVVDAVVPRRLRTRLEPFMSRE